jgi:predicted NBD/HSP70 family sugar kinase
LPGARCYCGKSGCIETFLSGPGLARDHAAHAGKTLAPEAIVVRAQAGDARAEATLARYEERLARALATVINLLDPEVIVLGGGLSTLAGCGNPGCSRTGPTRRCVPPAMAPRAGCAAPLGCGRFRVS